ncbi:hypothetical protein Bcop_0450 [Bacteroides coprosuis DSM 18011]|uniref:Outer membrane protein beta-barrel domain-containing protein n=1 Tax=Bacteroides coprosuis DSM 18011 TaxID=679937 RepID=F3ZR75_9BACE|nr:MULTISPECIES: porin family protein [Bacteroides]EGJ70668.1 hypothetical protein Bcop_0450 [Bacteroides coprosuis DSM 18011]
MKKLMVLVCVLMLGIGTSFAQKGAKSLGVNVGYGTEIENVGIGAKFQYNILDDIRLEPSLNFYMKKDGLSMWDLNLNAHYLFHLTSKFNVYPLAGITYTSWKQDLKIEGVGSETSNKFGANVGLGAEYFLSNNFVVNLDIKYQAIKDFDQAVFTFGAAYKF